MISLIQFYKNRLKSNKITISSLFTQNKLLYLFYKVCNSPRRVVYHVCRKLSVGDKVRLDLIKIRKALKEHPDVYQYCRDSIGDGIFTIKEISKDGKIRIVSPDADGSCDTKYLIKVNPINDHNSNPNQTTIDAIKESRDLLSAKQSEEEYTFIPKEDVIPVIVDGVSGYLIKK